MYFNYIFVFNILLLNFIYVEPELVIRESGIETLQPNDVGVVFYFKLQNMDNSKYQVYILKKRCCEDGENYEQRCDLTVLGSDMGEIQPNDKKKIKLLWPNMYTYNRKGSCKMIISYKTPTLNTDWSHLRYEVYFDTSLQNKFILPAFKRSFKDIKKQCNTQDLDPLHYCQPVDCQMKYSGTKNFFSTKFKTCLEVPICSTTTECGEKPDTGYVPTNNKCRNLHQEISTDDLPRTSRSVKNRETINILKPNVRCNNGIPDNRTGFCACDPGWTSDMSSLQKFEPNLDVYHLCNVKVRAWKEESKSRINSTLIIFGVLSVSMAMLVLWLTICLYCVHNFMQKYVTGPEHIDTSSSWTSWDCRTIPSNKTKIPQKKKFNSS